ncbi:MAG: DUF1320 domain-containing protein, partial [Prevotellaceae bacterium]|nr:DUF1320 domain-containing protein [Prevotellaceae bacterium]
MYLNVNDLKKGTRGEVLDTITRSSAEVIDQAIEDAQAEVESRLSARYDIAKELQKTAESPDRVTMVVKLIRDIALYNCFSFSAPVNMPESRVKAYDNAIKFLRDAQAEKANIIGLSRLNTNADGTTSSSYVAFGGNEKRNNY